MHECQRWESVVVCAKRGQIILGSDMSRSIFVAHGKRGGGDNKINA